MKAVVPESRLLDGDGRPRWDDAVLARADLLKALSTARAWKAAGASSRWREPPPLHEVAGHLRAAAGRRSRGHQVGGDRDFALDGQRALHRALVEAGVRATLTVVTGLAHCYPPDWPDMGARLVSDLVG